MERAVLGSPRYSHTGYAPKRTLLRETLVEPILFARASARLIGQILSAVGDVPYASVAPALAQSNAVPDQRRRIGSSETDAWGRPAVAFDVRGRVAMLRICAFQIGIVGVGLWVVPANSLSTSQDILAVVQDLTIREVDQLTDPQF